MDNVLVPVTINIIGVEDNVPSFYHSQQFINISENKKIGSVIANCSAKDADLGVGGILTYSVVTGK